ncbi:hypothetical protein XHC_0113 [Xanthomonas hortorum pv. carotae str. M081]|nr:hypothetical protein XHC_0113 [Xanthomonas hortorum pv. carotae str. M081]
MHGQLPNSPARRAGSLVMHRWVSARYRRFLPGNERCVK